MNVKKMVLSHPLRTVNLATLAILTLANLAQQNSIDFWLLTLLALLVWVIIADTDRMVIPDTCNLLIATLGLAAIYWQAPLSFWVHVYTALATFFILFLIETVYRKARGHSGLGMGDVKLLGACALWVGPEKISATVLIAAATAIAFVFARSIVNSQKSYTQPLPFGPFIAPALWFQLTAIS